MVGTLVPVSEFRTRSQRYIISFSVAEGRKDVLPSSNGKETRP